MSQPLSTHAMDPNLATMAEARRYNQWMYQVIEPHLGARVLEAGAGIGSLTARLLGRERLVAVDLEPRYVERLQARFGGRDEVRVARLDLADAGALAALAPERFDTVVCLNVLEHLEDDQGVLEGFRDLLAPGGRVVILVPQGRWLYGSLDRCVGHHRRYSRADLRGALEAAGFRVEALLDFNRVGSLGWFWNGRVLGREALPEGQVAAFDRLVPVIRGLEPWLPSPGLSVIGVGRRSG